MRITAVSGVSFYFGFEKRGDRMEASVFDYQTEQFVEVGLKKLVVGYDASPASERALQDAIAIAKQFQSEIVLVQVNTRDDYFTSSFDAVRGEAMQRFQDLRFVGRQLASEGLRSRGIVRNGTAAVTLANVCCEEKADLLLLGAYGYRQRDRKTLGSTAESPPHCPVPDAHVRAERLLDRRLFIATRPRSYPGRSSLQAGLPRESYEDRPALWCRGRTPPCGWARFTTRTASARKRVPSVELSAALRGNQCPVVRVLRSNREGYRRSCFRYRQPVYPLAVAVGRSTDVHDVGQCCGSRHPQLRSSSDDLPNKLAVGHLLQGLGVAGSFGDDFGAGDFDLLEVGGSQFDVCRADIFFEAREFGGAGDGDDLHFASGVLCQ
jgi:nucleotide-binding universal stress UspA family protein